MKKDAIKPLQDQILVKRSEPKGKTLGGIIIPEIALEDTGYGTVVAIGPGKINSKGLREIMSVKVGDVVYFTKNATIEVQHKGVEHLIMKEERVLVIQD